jgi:uncharacterized protein YlxW (UPF0749 family)
MYQKNIIYIIIFIFCITGLFTGCKSQQTFTNNRDFEQLRSDYQQLKYEYEKLQSDYSKLIQEQQFYANYYKNTTDAIESNIAELYSIGNEQLTEIEALRKNIAVLRNIIQSIIDEECRTERQNIKIDTK